MYIWQSREAIEAEKVNFRPALPESVLYAHRCMRNFTNKRGRMPKIVNVLTASGDHYYCNQSDYTIEIMATTEAQMTALVLAGLCKTVIA